MKHRINATAVALLITLCFSFFIELFINPSTVRAADIELVEILDATNHNPIAGQVQVNSGQEKAFVLRVTNGDQPTHVVITSYPVLTNDQGQLDAQPNANKIELDGALSFPKIVTGLPTNPIAMSAGETRDIPFVVKVPQDQEMTELITGGIDVSIADGDSLIGQSRNSFGVSMDIRTGMLPLPTAKAVFSQVRAAEYQGRDGITIDVANHIGNFFAAQSITGEIRSVDQAVQPRSRALKQIQMAPHSNFTFFIPHADLKMGKYVVTMSARRKNKTIKRQTFAVTVDRRLATAASKAELQTQVLIQRWLLAIAVGGVVVIALIFAVIHWRRSRREAIR